MILSCPNCGTQYVVKDGAIPSAGRQVRCASCKHRWHQDPEPGAVSLIEEEAPPVDDNGAGSGAGSGDADGDEDSFAEAALIDPSSGPEAEERAFAETVVEGEVADTPPPADHEDARTEPGDTPALYEEILMPRGPSASTSAEEFRGSDEPGEPQLAEGEADDFSPFAASEDDPPRRRSTLLTLLVIVLLVAALAAAFSFLAPPEWQARLGLGSGGASPLAIVITHREREQLQSGNQLLTISGRIVNSTSREQSVPPIQAQLQTRDGGVIHSWTIAPPTRRLAPGKSASFNSAEVNVPPGGEVVTFTTASNG